MARGGSGLGARAPNDSDLGYAGMNARHGILAVLLAVASAAQGADVSASAAAPAAGTSPRPPWRLDPKNRRITIDAVVAQREDSLEFLLCTTGTKEYESLLATPVRPSTLHAALLALGLRPGKAGRWSEREGKEPVFLPPAGAKLALTVRWKDAKGQSHEAPVSNWLLAGARRTRPKALSFVFVGSAILDDGSYWADSEGHHVSLANFASSVIDVPFASSDKTALLEFAPDRKTVPPKGTPVELVITALPGGEKAPDARVTFTIDSLGRIEMDAVAVLPEQIGPAVKEFLARHSRGTADVIIDPRAMAFDRQRLADILADAGMTEVSFRTRRLTEEVLPRTSDEAARAIAWWRKQLAQAGDQLIDPADDARALLKHIEAREREVEALRTLWSDYAGQIKTLLARRAHREKANPDESATDHP